MPQVGERRLQLRQRCLCGGFDLFPRCAPRRCGRGQRVGETLPCGLDAVDSTRDAAYVADLGQRTERGVCAASTATAAAVVFLVKPLDFIKPGKALGGFVGLLGHTAGRGADAGHLLGCCLHARKAFAGQQADELCQVGKRLGGKVHHIGQRAAQCIDQWGGRGRGGTL